MRVYYDSPDWIFLRRMDPRFRLDVYEITQYSPEFGALYPQ